MPIDTDEHFMSLALEACRRGLVEGQTPFGACLVKDGQLVVADHNRVWQTGDATAHAEICAIRQACRLTGSISLAGCTLYSTVEPCPMCFAATHWARCDRLVFGATISDAESYGFNELVISTGQMRELGGLEMAVTSGVLREASLALFRMWRQRARSAAY